MVHSEISLDLAAVAEVCRTFGVKRLRVFGSALRSDFDPRKSDIDLLVEFLPGVSKGLFKLAEMQEAFAILFGRNVDLMTPANLSKYFRENVLRSAEVLYDAE